jgi:hypothetical protein
MVVSATKSCPSILITTGGGGIGTKAGDAEYDQVTQLAKCTAIDVIAAHRCPLPKILPPIPRCCTVQFCFHITQTRTYSRTTTWAGGMACTHSYASAEAIDQKLAGYERAIANATTRGSIVSRKRLILQEWGATGVNSTVQADAFTKIAQVGWVRAHTLPCAHIHTSVVARGWREPFATPIFFWDLSTDRLSGSCFR